MESSANLRLTWFLVSNQEGRKGPDHRGWRKRSSKYWLSALEWLKNRGSERYFNPLCRWTQRHQRGNHSSVSWRLNINAVSCIRYVIPWNTCQTKIESPSVRILKQSIRHQRKKKLWTLWNGSQKNGVKNIPIPWGRLETELECYALRFSSFLQKSERSFIRPTPLRAWTPLIVS